MNSQGKQRKSKNVVLCRSSRKDQGTSGKEIQGLVFDHPLMPKIVTVSSAPRKTASSGNRTGQRPLEHYPTGHRTQEQYPTGHRTQEQYPTGHRTQEQYPTGYQAQEQYPTRHQAPEQYHTGHQTRELQSTGHYPTVHRPREHYPTIQHPQEKYPTGHYAQKQYPTGHRAAAQYPSHSSPPALIHTPSQYSTQRQISLGGLNDFGHFKILPSRAKPPQVERSQISFPSHHDQANALATTVPLPTTTHMARGAQFQYPQHETNSHPRAQQTTIRRNSTGALRHHSKQGVRYSENGVRYSENGVHYSENGVQCSERATKDLPTESTDQFSRDFHLKVWRESHEWAARSLHPPARRSDQPVRGLDQHVHLPRTAGRNIETSVRTAHGNADPSSLVFRSGMNVTHARRYSTGHPRLQNAEGWTSGEHNPGGARSKSWTCDEINPRVRSAEGTISQVPSIEEYSPVLRSAEETNSEVSSPEYVVPQADKIQRQLPQRNRRRQKRQHSPTVVIISDSDDENETKIPSTTLSSDSDQDVFMVTQNDSALEPNRVVVLRSLSSNSTNDRTSESEPACYITKVKERGDKSEQESTGPSRICQSSRAHDVNNNTEPSRKGDTILNYRSVLCERELSRQSGMQRVVMSEEVLFDKGTRGTKRTSGDKTEYFIAGAAEIVKSSLDAHVSKIRRVSCDELDGIYGKTKRPSIKQLSVDMNSNTCHQSLRDKRGCVYSGENSKPQRPRDHEDMPKLIRSRSEDDEQIRRQKHIVERSYSLTNDLSPSQLTKTGDCISNPESKNIEHFEYHKHSSESHCKVCFDRPISLVGVPDTLPKPGASSVTSRDEFRCHSCDRVLTERQGPGNEVSHTAMKLPKIGPKPTGIVVGVKQSPEVKQPLESKTIDPEKHAKDSKDKCTDDVICEDPKSGKTKDGLDILHFTIVKKDADVTCTDVKNHVKHTASPRDQVLPSQQWEAYSLKLEQDRVAKTSCCEETGKTSAQGHDVTKRNSWEELKRKFRAEHVIVSQNNLDNAKCSDTNSFDKERCNATRKRAHSTENVLEAACKSPTFRDTKDSLEEQCKRRKLSEVGESDVLAGSTTCNSFKNSNIDSCETQNTMYGVQDKPVENVLCSVRKQTANLPKNYKLLPLTKYPTKKYTPPIGMQEIVSKKQSPEKLAVNTRQSSPSDVRPSEERPSEVRPLEIRPSEVRPSEVRPSNVNTQVKDSSSIPPSGINEVEPAGVKSPRVEPQAGKSPQKEELSLAEWKEILEGRIEQVKESIEEEKTPWKTKNKKKVLEKLQNLLQWINGPQFNEVAFISRKIQFFQTMRKQYELMRNVKSQRKTMKTSDNAPQQVAENVETPVVKAAKEVEVPKKKTKEIKKVVNCRPKSVKNNGHGLMKKIRKAVLS